MEVLINSIMLLLKNLIQGINDWISTIQLSTELIALLSIIVSVVIFSMGKRYELRFKKHELKKEQYVKFIRLLEEVFTKTKIDDDSEEMTKSFEEMRKDFFDMGSSLLLYGSKKLYKQYVFYREFSANPAAKLSKHYDQKLTLYILADMLKTMRKEVGLNYLSNISDVEILAFFVNDVASNPKSKIESFKARYQLKMVRLEVFIFDQINLVVLKKLYYAVLAPIIGILGLIYKYLIMVPIGKLILLINPNAQESIAKFEEKIKNNY
ncbi:hypothetical protein DES36_12513 [Alkalibaculum bacchi]|uniref:Uncharacterized protein n=1 Tax=Alkalibaculum bacchi TaxID=645887 RepID=A0A366HZB9_9FIRM|nr:hypothetical protein [Alkalibaculum bacchi]RBP58078.1 hypothetical protein DES36_12513 [Alkalibaculum bacchi]